MCARNAKNAFVCMRLYDLLLAHFSQRLFARFCYSALCLNLFAFSYLFSFAN